MKHFISTDIARILFLWVVMLGIYYPVFYSVYLYTDEAPQIWLANRNINLTSVPQGRYLTYIIFKALFSVINTTEEIKYARLLSLVGWMLCLPVWYYSLKKIILDQGLPSSLITLSLLYLICMPSFTISVGWSACLEMFAACTCGLLAGKFCYTAINTTDSGESGGTVLLPLAIIVFGLISLFTYQNCFGCFFIPFFIILVSKKKITRGILIGIGWGLFVYVLYYLLFKWSLQATHMLKDERSDLASDPGAKIIFLFTRPLAASFHFTRIFADKSVAGVIIYLFIILCWFALTLHRIYYKPLKEKAFYFVYIAIFFVLVYLPSLMVVENYPSNRTLFALNFIVFILIMESLFFTIKSASWKKWLTGLIMLLLIASSWYNYRYEFLYPARTEYTLIRDVIHKYYKPSSKGIVYVIRPSETFFVQHYGIVASWDEFGVPSTAKKWTIEFLIKQIVFEKTGDHASADNLVIKSWDNRASFQRSGIAINKDDILLDIEALFQ